MNKNQLKIKLKNNIPSAGIFLTLREPSIVEMAAMAGLDWVIVDMEHFSPAIEKLQEMVRAANLVNITLLARVPFNKDEILRVVDSGVSGVVIPHIKTAIQAEEVIRWTKYSPEGNRGFSHLHRAGLFGTISVPDYIREANEEMLIALMIEDMEGMRNLSDIIKVKNLDLIFIGPNDLSQSLLGKVNPGHPKVIESIKHLISCCNKIERLACGVLCGKYTDLRDWIDSGAIFFSLGNDVGFFINALKTEKEYFNRIIKNKFK